ncbi:MAG: SDR family NAD(P)-dependent oxidoreductase [Planctomycetota bacterium]
MELTLKGQRALVTGGGTGIGRAIAGTLAQAGANVVIVGRREPPLEEVATAIAAEGGQCAARPVDVRDAGAVNALFEELVREAGAFHVLVNNAGAGGPNACSDDGPDRWDEIVRTNLDGTFFCSRAALKDMPNGGRIINISSVLGRFGVPGYTAYCASKTGVIGFTRALALEVAPRKINVNAICPGWVETEMAREGMELLSQVQGTSYEEARKMALSIVPIQRIVEPAEVADLVHFMASPAAGAMTGQAVALCGGATMV